MPIIAKETWKPIPGYEGLYEASDYGRIRSLSGYRGINMWGAPCYIKGRILHPCKNRKKYLAVQFRRKTLLVHRLVALTFFPTPDADILHINHIDCDKENNCIENLEWCDHLYNTAHAVENGRYVVISGENNMRAKLTENQVCEIRELLKTNLTEGEIAERFDITRSTISGIKHNRVWKHLK